MWRDVAYDPRSDDRDRPDASRRGTAGADLSDGRGRDPRDVFVRDLDLPRGPARERVHRPGRTYALHGGDVRTLATVGAFRVVPDVDLRDRDEGRSRDLRHLQELGLVRTVPHVIGKTRTKLVTLTDRGREVLEDARRGSRRDTDQAFYAGVSKPRELSHDAHLYRAYTKAADRLVARDSTIRRVVLEEALKREYQQFLQASNRRRRDSDGRPDRSADDIAEWARAHQLPIVDDRLHFPDVRIEYDERDGRPAIEDLEVLTPHYRGAHAAAKGRAGFTCYRAMGARLGGAGGSSRSGGRGFDPRVAEEMLG
jgi:DNA-binding MarR family transcriptional regulator